MSSGRSGISFKVSKGDIEMMGFHDDQDDPESKQNFWLITIAIILVVIIFVAEMFVLMLDI